MTEDSITDLVREEITELKNTLDQLHALTLRADAGLTGDGEADALLKEYCAIMDRHSVVAFTHAGIKKYQRQGLAARLEFLLESFDDELTGWGESDELAGWGASDGANQAEDW